MYNTHKRNAVLTVQRAQYKNLCNNRRLSDASTSNTMQESPEEEDQENSGRSFPLPPELLLEVMSYTCHSQATLHAASLVCKQWFHCIAPILYCHPQISDTYRWATFILTLTRERMSFFYGDLIRSIDLSAGKSIEAMKDQEFFRRLSNSNDAQAFQQRYNTAAGGELDEERSGGIRRISATTAEALHGHGEREHHAIDDIGSTVHQNRHILLQQRRQQQQFQITIQQQPQEVQEYSMKGLPYIIVSTSSLIQISKTSRNITSLNLSYTSLLYDSVVAETGEYLSTLRRNAVQPGLTHIQIPIEQVIEAIGKECHHLQEVKLQRCEWVTARVIWMFAYYCKKLKSLDARRSTKCTVKKLIAIVLEDTRVRNRTLSTADITTTPSFIRAHAAMFAGADEDQGDEDDEDDYAPVHLTFNVETDEFEPVQALPQPAGEVNGRSMHANVPDMHVFLENEEENRRPFAAQRQHAMMQYHALNSVPVVTHLGRNKSLKTIVYEFLKEARDLGAIDLNWLQDYV